MYSLHAIGPQRPELTRNQKAFLMYMLQENWSTRVRVRVTPGRQLVRTEYRTAWNTWENAEWPTIWGFTMMTQTQQKRLSDRFREDLIEWEIP